MMSSGSAKLRPRPKEYLSLPDAPRGSSFVDTVILLLLIIFCLFAPHSIAVTQTAFYTALAVWLMNVIWRRSPEYKPSALDLPIVAFVAVTILSAAFSYEPAVSLRKLGSVSLCLIFFLVTQQIRTARLAMRLVLVMVVSCLVNVAYVYWQRVHGHGLEIVQMAPESPFRAIGLSPGDVILEVDGHPVDSLQQILQRLRRSDSAEASLFVYRPEFYFRRGLPMSDWGNRSELGIEVTPWREFRAAGFFGWNYFTYAEVLQLLASIAVGLLLHVERKRSWVFAALAMIVVAMSVVIILTVTRAVWVAFAVAVLMMSLRLVNRRAILIVVVVVVITTPLALQIFQQTRGQPLLSIREPSTAYRLTIWAEGVNLILRQPRHLILGIGMDSLKYHWREWGLFQGGKLPLGHMHSTPLQIALERGLPALICFGWWFGAYLLLLRRLTGERAGSLNWVGGGICLGIYGGVIGFLASSLVHYNFGDSEVVMIVYFLMGVSVVIDRELRCQQRAACWSNQ